MDLKCARGRSLAIKLYRVLNRFPGVCLILLAVLRFEGQTAPVGPTETQAEALVERALATESRAAEQLSRASHPMRYRLRKTSPRLTTVKEIVETREEARLEALKANPGLQAHRKQSEDSDAARAMKVLRVLPNAFLYHFEGTGTAGQETIDRFSFKPNPRFDPPDLETGVLTAMAGELWVDPVAERVVRLAGSLVENKDFGLGILGQLDKGGSVEIQQADVGDRQWRIVHLKLVMNGRVLFKAKNSNSVQEYSGFVSLPADLTYGKAIQMLREDRAPAGGTAH
jgi:hypothetical protein